MEYEEAVRIAFQAQVYEAAKRPYGEDALRVGEAHAILAKAHLETIALGGFSGPSNGLEYRQEDAGSPKRMP